MRTEETSMIRSRSTSTRQVEGVARRFSAQTRTFCPSPLLGANAEHEHEQEPIGHDAYAMMSRESCFAPIDFCRDLVGANFDYKLFGCDVVMVFLVATDLGGIETSVCRSGGIRLENCADGSGGIAEIAETGGMVLPAQRIDESLALHAADRFVRTDIT